MAKIGGSLNSGSPMVAGRLPALLYFFPHSWGHLDPLANLRLQALGSAGP